MLAMFAKSGINPGSSKYINEMTKQKTRSRDLFVHLVTTDALKQKEKKMCQKRIKFLFITSAVSRQSLTTATENLRQEYKNWLRVTIPTDFARRQTCYS